MMDFFEAVAQPAFQPFADSWEAFFDIDAAVVGKVYQSEIAAADESSFYRRDFLRAVSYPQLLGYFCGCQLKAAGITLQPD